MAAIDARDAIVTEFINVCTTNSLPYKIDAVGVDVTDKLSVLSFYPASNEAMGKTSESSSDFRGFFQIDVFTETGHDYGDRRQFQIMDFFFDGFENGLVLTSNGQTVQIEDASFNNLGVHGNFKRFALRFNFTSYLIR